jgi:hypothetical protein
MTDPFDTIIVAYLTLTIAITIIVLIDINNP